MRVTAGLGSGSSSSSSPVAENELAGVGLDQLSSFLPQQWSASACCTAPSHPRSCLGPFHRFSFCLNSLDFSMAHLTQGTAHSRRCFLSTYQLQLSNSFTISMVMMGLFSIPAVTALDVKVSSVESRGQSTGQPYCELSPTNTTKYMYCQRLSIQALAGTGNVSNLTPFDKPSPILHLDVCTCRR